METLHERVIRTWMTKILQDGGVERFDDLHVDQIDKEWKQRDRWIDAGLESFRLAVGIRDELRISVTVGLAFSLEVGKSSRGVDFASREELQARLDWSPPSLYLFQKAQEPWNQTEGYVELDGSVLGPSPLAKGCYFYEFKQVETQEYVRVVWLAA